MVLKTMSTREKRRKQRKRKRYSLLRWPISKILHWILLLVRIIYQLDMFIKFGVKMIFAGVGVSSAGMLVSSAWLDNEPQQEQQVTRL